MDNRVIDTIKNRRSTRAFSSEQIKQEELDIIIEAGLYAPSAHNDQSWLFTIVQDRETIEQINKDSKACAVDSKDTMIRRWARNEKFDVFYGAPTLIIVSGEEKAMMPEIDCAAATQNMLLAAESLNIGTCWNGFAAFLFDTDKREEYIEKLKIPEGHRPYYAIAIGYKAKENTNAPKRRENRVIYL